MGFVGRTHVLTVRFVRYDIARCGAIMDIHTAPRRRTGGSPMAAPTTTLKPLPAPVHTGAVAGLGIERTSIAQPTHVNPPSPNPLSAGTGAGTGRI